MSSSSKSSSQMAMIGDFFVLNFFPAKPANIRFCKCFFFPFFPKNSFVFFLSMGSRISFKIHFTCSTNFSRNILPISSSFSPRKNTGEKFPQLLKQEKTKAAWNMMLNLRCFSPMCFSVFSKMDQNQRKWQRELLFRIELF